MREESNPLPVPSSSNPQGSNGALVSTDLAPQRVDVTPVQDAASGAGRRRSSGEISDILRTVHRSLRGRYILAILLGLIGAAGGVYGGLRMGRPFYKSESLIRIAYTMP